MTNFRVGQKVVCVAKGRYLLAEDHGWEAPKRYGQYTVREVYIEPLGIVGIRLVEIINPTVIKIPGSTALWEIGWEPSEFRPMTDISIFEKMLKTEKIHASA